MSAKIFVIDDSEDVRRFVCLLLKRKDYEVEAFPDGQQALAAILSKPPDLIISDIQMPHMDGLELTKRVRDHFDKRTLPIILVSVMSAEEDILSGFDAGANDYLIKPFKTAELVAKVGVLLRTLQFLRRPEEPELPAEDPQHPTDKNDETKWIKRPAGGPTSVEKQPRYFFDKYEIVGEFGKGGMGTVYRAKRREDNAEIALKVLAPKYSQDRYAISRFLREIQALRSIESPFVVRFLDDGYDSGRYFLAMEAVTGQSLQQLFAERGPLSEVEVAKLFMQVSDAITTLASHNLVHRDIKPSNIIVADNQVKLVDFGLAKTQGKTRLSLSDPSIAIGTPYYISPEVIEGKEATEQSDVFSTGVTMFEVLTGRRPFPGNVPYHIFKLIVSGARPSIQEYRPELTEDMANIVNRCLFKDLNSRYKTAAELKSELGRWLEKHN